MELALVTFYSIDISFDCFGMYKRFIVLEHSSCALNTSFVALIGDVVKSSKHGQGNFSVFEIFRAKSGNF